MSKYLADDCTVDLGIDDSGSCIRCIYGDLATYNEERNNEV